MRSGTGHSAVAQSSVTLVADQWCPHAHRRLIVTALPPAVTTDHGTPPNSPQIGHSARYGAKDFDVMSLKMTAIYRVAPRLAVLFCTLGKRRLTGRALCDKAQFFFWPSGTLLMT